MNLRLDLSPIIQRREKEWQTEKHSYNQNKRLTFGEFEFAEIIEEEFKQQNEQKFTKFKITDEDKERSHLGSFIKSILIWFRFCKNESIPGEGRKKRFG